MRSVLPEKSERHQMPGGYEKRISPGAPGPDRYCESNWKYRERP